MHNLLTSQWRKVGERGRSYTEFRSLKLKGSQGSIICRFEHLDSSAVIKHEFEMLFQFEAVNISSAWNSLKFCIDRIQRINPTTRVLTLKLFVGDGERLILTYRTGAQVLH